MSEQTPDPVVEEVDDDPSDTQGPDHAEFDQETQDDDTDDVVAPDVSDDDEEAPA